MIETFADLELRPELLDALSALGYEEPTPIQAEAIPPLLAGRDLLGNAATGTGKTAAFALPLLQRMSRNGARTGARPMGLVLVPTRELANQVSEAIHRYGRELGARVLPIYGGQPIYRQLKLLDRGVDIVVATPGRALDHVGRGTLLLDDLEVSVLDEADEMLDMGFAEDIEAILEAVPSAAQRVLFSATMPARIAKIVRGHLRDEVRIEVTAAGSGADGVTPLVRESAYIVSRAHKPTVLGRVLDVESPTAALVFCRTRAEVDQIASTLNGRGYRAEALHGGMTQEQRERVMGRLRTGTADLIVATDVAARGLDIEQLTHVINYDVPSAPDAYVHRIGRVGRAGRAGIAITLAEPREHRMLKSIERATGRRIPVERVPTVADLRARRLETTRAALHESLSEDDLDGFRVVVERLADEFDLMEIALAAVKLAHEATSGTAAEDEDEIPEVADTRPGSDKRRPAGRDAGGKAGSGGNGGGGARRATGPMSRLWIGAGHNRGIRPQDLVGAITGETSVSGREIGAIHVAHGFSLVEVPETAVEEVIVSVGRSTIKGKRATVRRDRNAPGARTP